MIRYDLAAQDIEDWGLKMKYIDGKQCMTKSDVIYSIKKEMSYDSSLTVTRKLINVTQDCGELSS